MATYMFVGSDAQIAHAVPLRLKQYGMKFELADEFLIPALEQNAPIIPADSPEAKAFTEEELKKFPGIMFHGRAPADFLAKKQAASIAVHNFREMKLKLEPLQAEHSDATPEITGEVTTNG